jgi:hypothetical protein
MSCSNGAFVPAFESHFWPGATVSTVWKPKGYDKRQVVITSVHDFVAQTPEGACSEPIFEEKMDTAEVKIHNGHWPGLGSFPRPVWKARFTQAVERH